MPEHKNDNRFRFVSPANPAQKKKPNGSLGSVSDAESDIAVLSNILENASSSKESLRRVTSVILGNTLIKNAPAMELVPEIGRMRAEIKDLHRQIDNLSQYSRKNV